MSPRLAALYVGMFCCSIGVGALEQPLAPLRRLDIQRAAEQTKTPFVAVSTSALAHTKPSLLASGSSSSGISQLLMFPVTCFFFFFEALVHFHIGKTGKLGISLPKGDELFKIVASIFICSGLSSGTIALIERMRAPRA